jgi:acyl-CoA synthetase (AMP-forming)/AMP-acid ligase II
MRRDGDDDPSYVGDVLPDVDVQIVDPETRVPVPDGQIGLVRTRSSTMALEYLGDPVATAESWRDGWFYAGDLGLLKGSKLFLAGRESEIINIGGLKVDPARIDTHFDSEPDFVEHAAFAIPMANGLECIGLAYVPTDTLDLAAVIDRANDTLGKFAPAIFVPVKKIPRNHLDKPQRKALGAWYAKSSSRLG